MKTSSDKVSPVLGQNPPPMVIDIGCGNGAWAEHMLLCRGCRLVGFEAVPTLYHEARARFKTLPRVHIHPYAVGERCGPTQVYFKEGDEDHIIEGRMIAFEEALGFSRLYTIDFVNINSPGQEFPILEQAIARNLVSRIKAIQVRGPLSSVFDAAKRWADICDDMADTHELLFSSKWRWHAWKRRE